MAARWYDAVPFWGAAVGTVAVFALLVEVGFWVARTRHKVHTAQSANESDYVFALIGALLTLVALLLGFSFTIVDERFAQRKLLVLEEANAIGTTYLRAGTLPDPHGERVRQLLKRYVDLRSPAGEEELRTNLARSARLHVELWMEAEAAAAEMPGPIVSLFLASLNHMIDLHQERLTVAIYYRLPSAIFGCLYLVSMLTMLFLGYSAAYKSKRTLLPTATVVTAISIALLLLFMLDRPGQHLIDVNQQALDDVRQTMATWPPQKR